MSTSMTGFRCFSKISAFSVLWMKVAPVLEGFIPSGSQPYVFFIEMPFILCVGMMRALLCLYSVGMRNDVDCLEPMLVL